MKLDIPYLKLLKEIQDNGNIKGDRTGTGTRSIFGTQMRFDLSQGHIPLLTTKSVNFNSILVELLWFISGSTNMTPLVQNGVNIWNEWPCKYWLQQTGQIVPEQADKDGWKVVTKRFAQQIKDDPDGFGKQWGELGPVYGKQWRDWETPRGEHIDQLGQVVKRIKTNPDCRRLIVCAWNPADIPAMTISGLPPCHCLFQFYVVDGRLSCLLYQRSCDYFLGVPYNIVSYSLLTAMIARVCGLKRGEFIWTGGDTHLYNNHIAKGVPDIQLSRTPRDSPILYINEYSSDLFTMTKDDFLIKGYEPDPYIPAAIAV